MSERLTHVDDQGAARMVDVSGKDVTVRTARASGRVLVSAHVVELLRGPGVPKGDTLAVARIAGIQGAQRSPWSTWSRRSTRAPRSPTSGWRRSPEGGPGPGGDPRPGREGNGRDRLDARGGGRLSRPRRPRRAGRADGSGLRRRRSFGDPRRRAGRADLA